MTLGFRSALVSGAVCTIVFYAWPDGRLEHPTEKLEQKADISARSPAAEPTAGAEPAPKTAREESASAHVPAPSASAAADDTLENFESRLAAFKACYSVECDFPNTDARSYELAVGGALRKVLQELEIRVSERSEVDPLISQIAREYLAMPDGHVQSAALHVLSTQPPSEDSLQAILDHVIGSHDAILVNHGLVELQRYLGSRDEPRIHQALAEALRSGAPYVAAEISKGIGPFLNEASFAIYAEALVDLPVGILSTRTLRAALDEYLRRNSGA